VEPFEFTITLLSFVYSLALTHILLGVARIVRHRRTIRLSTAHAVWTVNVFVTVLLNWIALWDFHGAKTLSVSAIGTSFFFAILLYLVATFVTPDVEDEKGQDLKAFHEREGVTYIGALLFGAVVALAMNLGAGSLGVTSWAQQNALLLGTLPILPLALIFRRGWPHIVLATASLATPVAFLLLYYPVLR
jgi:hypothetical protein